jgi:hypothetical protein
MPTPSLAFGKRSAELRGALSPVLHWKIGYEFGQKTHLHLPGGVLVDEEPWRHAEAVARTVH